MTSARRIGLLAATGIGVGSMLGAGVFSGMWASVMAAGQWYLAALVLAGAVATANALSTAQLAARHPVAGGAYAYGRAELGAFAGRVAGTAFVLGKTASVGVGAVVLGLYVVPGHSHVVATAAIVLCWALNARGVTRTAAGATVIAILVSAVLLIVVAMGFTVERSFGWFSSAQIAAETADARVGLATVLAGASAAFFAFAGYARIATLGEEVREPERNIPRAIGLALAWVLAIYLGLAVTLRASLGPGPAGANGSQFDHSALAEAPIHELARSMGLPTAVVTIAAALAVGGAMLAVMAGAGRTAMAMARHGDLPRLLAVQGRSGAPARAEAVIAAAAIGLVWLPDLDLLLLSVATMLAYYAVANLAAIAQRRAGHTASLRVPLVVSAGGLLGSVTLGVVALAGASTSAWPALVIVALVVGWPALSAIHGRMAGHRS